jgi:glyoxylase-like metal-dependent hydrolase (beta-lactamase superfamily II)
MFDEIAPGVFTVEHQVVEGKNGIIFGRRGALAIDSGNYPEEGQAVADFIRARGGTPDRLALTHGHGDHILGGAALAGGEVFAHAATPAVILRQVQGWAERSSEPVEQVQARTIRPTIMFTQELRLDLGDRLVRLFHTPGHSEDGACVYLEEERVLFAGDTVVTGIVPAIGDGSSRQLESSLHRLAEMEIELLVPGHGPVLRRGEVIREWLQWLASYLSEIRSFVRGEMSQGRDAEAVADAAEYVRFVGDRLPVDRHSMIKRHRSTVMKIIQEERA